jgi:hypothetical protein
MSEEFEYEVLLFHMPSDTLVITRKLETAYNDGWKPTGPPVLIQESYPGESGGIVHVMAIYTLAKEKIHDH